MKTDCVLAMGSVLGRQPTEAEIRNVEERIAASMRKQAASDPQAWIALPVDAQVRSGAERAALELQGEAVLKQRRAVLKVQAVARVQAQLASFPGAPLDALAHLVAFHTDVKGAGQSIETRAKAIERDALRQMLDTLEATSPKFFGLIEDQAGIRDLVRELHGETTGNPDAKSGATAFRNIAEAMRQRFNAAGGDIGQLDDWGMPHHHSQIRVAQAGRDAWVQGILPRLNRSRYVTATGARMNDAEVRAFLGEAWQTIAQGGLNKRKPGEHRGSGMRANRGNESRQIHFKNADAYLDYQRDFGERDVYGVLLGHISGIAKDLALVETLGPNPDATFQLFLDRALDSQSAADPASTGAAESKAGKVDVLYQLAAGKSPMIVSPKVARFFDGLRNIMVASKLGSATITAITDEGTMRVAARVNNLPQMQLIRNELAAFNPTNAVEKRLALRAGLAMNTLAQSLDRFGNETLGSGWSSKLSSATIRASGLAASTDARRRAYGVTMMGAIGAAIRDAPTLAQLDNYDQRILKSKGITPDEYEVMRRATLEDWGDGNDTLLTPDAIYAIPDAQLSDLGNPQQLREQAATRLLGTVLEETDIAVIEPGIRERALMYGNHQRGSWKGEITRSLFLFKSFPIAMITKHWSRALAEPTNKGKAHYAAALIASTTLIGMVAQQAAQVVQGKDPKDMTEWKAWVQALLKGGALSLFGDFLFNDETEHGGSALTALAGPVFGFAEDALALTLGNVHQAARGEETHFGAEAVKFVKSNTPGANLWYTRAATDHLIFHQLQEYLSPGYLQKMKRRSEKEYGTSFWWEPGETLPERAPDPAALKGE